MNRNPALLAAIAILSAWCASATGGDVTWYQPLDTKARILEEQVLKWHWIDGLYPSQVEVPPDGGAPDHSTNGVSNVMHMVCWTANHWAGESYRYAYLKEHGTPEEIEAVRRHVNEMFDGMYRCQKVTGIKGFQARGYLYGHGPTYEERTNSDKADYWYQGAGEYKDLRWRGSPSHHNYSDSIHGYGVYYRLAAEGEYKDKCRQAIDDLVSIWADNDWMIPTKDATDEKFSILGITDGKNPNLRIVMAAAGLKVAHHATGKEKFAKEYEKLVTQFSFRERTTFPRTGHLDTDDGEHVFCHLDNLLRIEEDPQLLRFYRAVLDALWDSHKNSKCPLFNYIYASLTPDAPDREKALADALWTLQSHPTNMFFQPRMNSIRDDIKKSGGDSVEPMAVFEAAWDNEYLWKGHLYQLDGWLSRPITAMDTAKDDPDILYAADSNNDIYRSVDGAKTWTWVCASPGGKVEKLFCGTKRRFVFIVTRSGAFRSTTGAETWARLPVPTENGAAVDLQLDASNPNRLYAVTAGAVYRSLDFGEEWFGERWECVTPLVPPARSLRLFLAQGEPTMVYGFFDETFRGMQLGGGEWSKPVQLNYEGYLKMYPWLLVDPGNPKSIAVGYKFEYRNIQAEGLYSGDVVGTLMSKSEDGGITWSWGKDTVIEGFKKKGAPALIMKAMAELYPKFLEIVAPDPRAAKTFYASTGRGFSINTNRGHPGAWRDVSKGLDIPVVRAIFVPGGGDRVYVDTPAGLYVLNKDAAEWQFAGLRLQFHRNTRVDLGGAAYLDAYWMGRYFGFITDELATQPPTEWKVPERYQSWIPKQ
ncbi:MAG TPA: hypothetical protein PL033_06080 [Candidatus Brocadiia bacterium]|nr:hypothetical protein [Candidatus Brocadiia bacterium]